MARAAPPDDVAEDAAARRSPKRWAAGIPGVLASVRALNDQLGVRKAARTMLRINQPDGFDCPGCAWPEPHDTSRFEFCENGAKAVAEEATDRRVTAEFFAAHSIDELVRSVRPLARPAGPAHRADVPQRRVTTTTGRSRGTAAFARIGRSPAVAGVTGPCRLLHVGADEQRGRVPVPAVRPRLRHQQPSRLLEHVPRVERSRARRDHRHRQGDGHARRRPRRRADPRHRPEPGDEPSPHAQRPRAGQAQRGGDRLDQPAAGGRADRLPQPASVCAASSDAAPRSPTSTCRSPSPPTSPCSSGSTGVSSQTWRRRSAVRRRPLRRVRRARRPTSRRLDADALLAATGLDVGRRRVAGRPRSLAATRIIVCWAMGLTQHRQAVATIQEIANTMLLRGSIGRRGAGLCPVRGHSNVQGDRTMGIFERPTGCVARRAWRTRFSFDPPRAPRLRHRRERSRRWPPATSTCSSASAATSSPRRPDTDVTAAAMERCALTVQVSTKLNRSHVRCGARGADPAVPRAHRSRSERGRRALRHRRGLDGHRPRHAVAPTTRRRRSCAARSRSSAPIAAATLGDRPIDWAALGGRLRQRPRPHRRDDPGLRRLQRAGRRPGGFALPNPPRDSTTFPTASGPGAALGQRVRADRRAPGTAAPADRAIARPVQHDDLRPRRPLPRRVRRPPGGVREPRRPRRPRARRRRPSSTSSASGATASNAGPPPSGSSPTRRRRGAARRTSRRPTCSFRSAASPRAAARRRPRRSSCASSGVEPCVQSSAGPSSDRRGSAVSAYLDRP